MQTHSILTIVCLLAVLCCVSCSSSDPATPSDPAIEGAWGLESFDHENDVNVYTRLDSLTGDQNGYQFDVDGTLTVRDAGWCGTPPLMYSNYEGTWVAESENDLRLNYPHWDGNADFRLEIVSLDANELRCRVSMIE